MAWGAWQSEEDVYASSRLAAIGLCALIMSLSAIQTFCPVRGAPNRGTQSYVVGQVLLSDILDKCTPASN